MYEITMLGGRLPERRFLLRLDSDAVADLLLYPTVYKVRFIPDGL